MSHTNTATDDSELYPVLYCTNNTINNNNSNDNTIECNSSTPQFIINEHMLSSPHTLEPLAELHSDSLSVSLCSMPCNSDVWCHTLSSPLKPLSLTTYKTVKQNPTKQCRLSMRINKAYHHHNHPIQHKRKLGSDGCHYITDSDSSDVSSDDDDDGDRPTTVKQYNAQITKQYKTNQYKRKMIQRNLYHQNNTTLQPRTKQHIFTIVDESSSSSDSDDNTDSDTDDNNSTANATQYPVIATHDGLTTSSDSDSVCSVDIDEESLIPSDLLEVTAQCIDVVQH